jgi:hypothetical protein
MAFEPYAGSDGRVLIVSVAADLTVPIPGTPTAGTTVAVAGLTSWKVSVSLEGSGTIHHFEGTALSTGPIWGESVQGGCIKWSADVEGFWDGDSTNTATKFAVGTIVEIDFLYSKGSTFGRKANVAKILEFTEGTQVKGERATFTAKVEGHGALSAPS